MQPGSRVRSKVCRCGDQNLSSFSYCITAYLYVMLRGASQLSSQPVLRKVRNLPGVLVGQVVSKSAAPHQTTVAELTCGLRHWPCPAEIRAAPAARLRSSRPDLLSRRTHNPVGHGATSPGIPLSFSGMISNRPQRDFGTSTSPSKSEESEFISNFLLATQTHYNRNDWKEPWKNT